MNTEVNVMTGNSGTLGEGAVDWTGVLEGVFDGLFEGLTVVSGVPEGVLEGKGLLDGLLVTCGVLEVLAAIAITESAVSW